MSPISTFITSCAMAIVSACIGAFLFLFGQLELGFSIAAGLGCFVLFYALQFHVFLQKTVKSTKTAAITHLHETATIMEMMSVQKRQIEKLEQDLNRSTQKIQSLINHQLDEEADKRAVLDARITAIEEQISHGISAPRGGYIPAPIEQKALKIEPSFAAEPIPTQQETRVSQPNLAKLVASALANDQVELCLEPIVTLPHRRPRFHQASLHIILPNGQRISTAELREWSLPSDILVRHDVKIFQKLALLIPEFRRRSPETAFFVDFHRETLRNGRCFSEILTLLEDNPKIVDQLIIGLTNSTISTLDPLENATLSALRKQNLRFCVTDITTLRLDMDNWSNMGMRFAEIPAHLLQNEQSAISSDIVLADIPLLLRRFGVEMIVTEVDAENIIVEVLDFDIRYGRGYLFGAPRSVAVPAASAEMADENEPAQKSSGAAA